MAFMGIFFFALIYFFVVVCLGIGGAVMLVAGIILYNKGKIVVSIILMILGGLGVLVFAITAIKACMPRYSTTETTKGTVKVKEKFLNEYIEYVMQHDTENLEKCLKNNPELINFPIHSYELLEYALFAMDIDMMSLALDYGAEFDKNFRRGEYEYYSSLYWLFRKVDSNPDIPEYTVTDDIIRTVDFAVKHGAKTKWAVKNEETEANSVYSFMRWWIFRKEEITEKDYELLSIINKQP
ncbi:MAG: hypothetical protein K2J08_05810 [Ruminococcus sp.]|nr:hypothetical protein [Ruminococcus sp.]